MLQRKSGVGELLQRDDRRRMIVAELLRRQNSIASIQKSLEAEEEQSKSVLLRLLAIDGNSTARGNATAIEGEEYGDPLGNATENLGGANNTDALNVSDANSTVGGAESEGEEAATNRSATLSTSASNTSSPARAIDEYAEARKIFARSNDTAEMSIALKEQPVTEYSNQTIRWAIPLLLPSSHCLSTPLLIHRHYTSGRDFGAQVLSHKRQGRDHRGGALSGILLVPPEVRPSP